MPSPLRAALMEHRATVEARHGAALAGSSRDRALALSVGAVAVAIYVFGLVVLDISPLAIANGLGRLGDIALLMLPPSPGTWGRFWLYTGALGQTVAIALLGTLIADPRTFSSGLHVALGIVAGTFLAGAALSALCSTRPRQVVVPAPGAEALSQ